jgi:cbb3-type cytochrome oxidase subunit 3
MTRNRKENAAVERAEESKYEPHAEPEPTVVELGGGTFVSSTLPQGLDVADSDYQFKLERYNAYIDERKTLDNTELDASKSYDQYLITLSSGALGLSLLFIEKVAKSPLPSTYPLLIAAWSFFALVLFLMLLSLLVSQWAWRRRRENLDFDHNRAENRRPVSPLPRWRKRRKKFQNPYDRATTTLNTLSLLLFFVGVVCFASFSAANLPQKGDDAMGDNTTKQQGNRDNSRGMPSRPSPAPPPRPPAPKTDKK